MGPVMVGGAYYVLTERVTAAALLASLPVGLLAAAILHANNLRDLEFDRAAGKITLATVLGRRRAALEYGLLLAGAYLVVIALVLVEPALWLVTATAVTLPIAARLVRTVAATAEPHVLNGVLRKTAGLHLRFGLLLTLGLLLAAGIDRLA
jgi:1,4-dihydroxy-2-naphthoate octaprenyltransferase